MSWALQREGSDAGGFEPPQAAVEVADGRAEEQPADARQQRIAQVSVQERHRAVLDAASEAVPEHEVAAALQLLPERRQRAEVVLPVSIAEDDEPAAGGSDAGVDRVTVACPRLLNDAGAGLFRKFRGAVPAGVVHHQDLPGDGVSAQEPSGFADAAGDGLLLVAAEDQYRQITGIAGGGGGGISARQGLNKFRFWRAGWLLRRFEAWPMAAMPAFGASRRLRTA